MALAAAKLPVKTKFVVREEAHTDAELNEIRELSDADIATRIAELEEERFRLQLPRARRSRWRIRCGCAGSARTSRG